MCPRHLKVAMIWSFKHPSLVEKPVVTAVVGASEKAWQSVKRSNLQKWKIEILRHWRAPGT